MKKKYVVRWHYKGRFEGYIGTYQACEYHIEDVQLFDNVDDAMNDAYAIWSSFEVENDDDRYNWDWFIVGLDWW